MKRLLFLLFIAIMFSQCSKISENSDDENTVKEYEGVFEGIYYSVQYYDFKAITIVESEGSDKVIIKPSSKTGHPEFYANVFATTTGNYGFNIPNQTSDGYTIVGIKMTNSEFDGGYMVEDKQLIYQMQIIKGDYTDTIMATPFKIDQPTTCFNGIKDGDETDVDCGGVCGECMEIDTIYKGNVRFFDFADVDNGIVYAESTLGGSLKFTHDGGATWLEVSELPTSGVVTDVAYFNDRIFVLQNHITYASIDNGTKWSKVNTLGFTSINYITQIDENLLILSALSDISITNDGATWEEVNIGSSISGVFSFLDESIGYAIASESNLIKTTNGGKKWKKVSVLPNSNIKCIHFTDENIGYAVGAFNEILSTSDGGKTWGIQYASEHGSYRTDMYFYEGYAITPDNFAIISTDNGVTWNEIPEQQFSYAKGDGVGPYYYMKSWDEKSIIRINLTDF